MWFDGWWLDSAVVQRMARRTPALVPGERCCVCLLLLKMLLLQSLALCVYGVCARTIGKGGGTVMKLLREGRACGSFYVGIGIHCCLTVWRRSTTATSTGAWHRVQATNSERVCSGFVCYCIDGVLPRR